MFTFSNLVRILNAAATDAATTANVGAEPATMTPVINKIAMPIGKLQNVPFEKLRRVHNVRVPAMEEMNASRLIPSIKANGFIAAYPLMVEESDHGNYNLLAGHGRWGALRKMSAKDRDAALSAFKGNVPALVFKNLSAEGRAAIRAHDFTASSDKMKGDKWSDQLIVTDFITSGTKLTDDDIASFMGWISEGGKNKGRPNRNRAMLHRRLYELGIVEPRLLEEYGKRWDTTLDEAKRTTPFTDGNIAELHQLLGNQPSGEALISKVTEVLTAAPTDATTIAIVPHKFSPLDAREMVKGIADTRVRRLLYAITGQGNGPGVAAEVPSAVIAEINSAFKAEKAPIAPIEVPVHPAKVRGHAKK